MDCRTLERFHHKTWLNSSSGTRRGVHFTEFSLCKIYCTSKNLTVEDHYFMQMHNLGPYTHFAVIRKMQNNLCVSFSLCVIRKKKVAKATYAATMW